MAKASLEGARSVVKVGYWLKERHLDPNCGQATLMSVGEVSQAQQQPQQQAVAGRTVMKSEYSNHYSRGWQTSQRNSTTGLENADSRGEPNAWYDGYHDYAAGREKFHSRDCPDRDHGQCG